MVRMFRTMVEVSEFAELMNIRIVEDQISGRTGITLFRVPEWDAEREAYCKTKMEYIKRHGSN